MMHDVNFGTIELFNDLNIETCFSTKSKRASNYIETNKQTNGACVAKFEGKRTETIRKHSILCTICGQRFNTQILLYLSLVTWAS